MSQHTTISSTEAGQFPDPTQWRLITAAEELFAEHGFGGTSVRDITAEAGANVAAVNYHFGSKHQLYQKLFEIRLAEMRRFRTHAVHRALDEAEPIGDVAAIVDTFARAFMQPLSDPQRGRIMLKLFMRELSDPHLPPGMFMQQMAEPMQELMRDALQRTCPGLGEQAARMCFHSLVGQLVHLVQVWKMMVDVGQTDSDLQSYVDTGLRHVVRFTVAGIKSCQEAGGS
ncbi:TetR/AcrR family transcriptional regulator [Planctomycetales bacterium ZRK34]|nr:TetR/AcrR family transcriptional regulator [Planctomycetales bacterium ZRK34]